MKKGLLIGLGVVGSVILIGLLAPSFVTLNGYKPEIQQKAFEATGRKIIINGDIRMGILPSPFARLTDVVVTNPEGAMSKEFASVKAIDVGVALLPLLSKKIQVTHIDVTQPAITLEVMANGQNNWQFKPQEQTPSIAQPETENAGSPTNLSIDEFTIEKGFIRYVDVPGKSQQTIGPIDGTFNVASLQGPIAGNGTITLLGKLPVRFEASIDALPENGPIPFKLALDVLDKAATANFNGTILKGEALSARVESAITASDPGKILGAISNDGQAPELPAYLAKGISLNGLIDYTDKTAKMDNLVIRAGNAEIAGSLHAEMKEKTSIAIDLKNMVLPPEMQQQATVQNDVKNSNENLAQTLENSFTKAAGFLDTSLPKTSLDLVVTATQLLLPGQPPMRDLRIAASSSEKGMTIQTIDVKLPGNTQVQLAGDLPARADGKIDNAKINAKISSQNLQAAIGKAGQATGTPLNLQTTLLLTRQNLRLQPLQIMQNGQMVQGDVTYTPRADEALVVALKGSALNLDALLGTPDNNAAAAKTQQAEKPAAKNDDLLAGLQGLKARISADLDSIIYKEKTANNITVQASISAQGLELRQASIGDLGGMSVTANGKVDRLSPLSGVAITAQAKTPNLSQTLKALGNKEAANLGASSFDAKLNGDADNLQVALNGVIDQGRIAVSGTAKNLNDAPGFNGVIDVSHPETATIVRNFGGLKPTVNLGAFAFKTNLTYGADTLKADDLLVKLGSAGTLQGHVNVAPDKNVKRIDADLRADKLALAALMGDDTQTSAANVNTSEPKQTNETWSKEPINLAFLRGMEGSANVEIGELLYKKFVINNFKTKTNFTSNAVGLERLQGSLFNNGQFNINGQLAPGAENQAHRGDFNITVANTDAAKLFVALGSKPFSKGTLDLNQKIAFNGNSPYAIINSLNGDGQVKITNGVVEGIDLDGLAAKLDRPNSLSDFSAIISQARAGGQTAIGNVTMPVLIRNGVVQVQNTTIKTQKTEMAMSGIVNLPPKTVDLKGQITFVEQRNLPPLTLLLTGPMNKPEKNFDTRSFTMFYAKKAAEKLTDGITDKISDKMNKLLGIQAPAPAAPAAPPATQTPTGTTPVVPAPVAPVAPAPEAPTTPQAAPTPAPAQQTPEQQRNDALKQLGGQMLNNLLGGGGR